MREFKFLYALALTAIVMSTQNACTQQQASKAEIDAVLAKEIISSRTLSGSYLAGRFAQHQQDWDAAQTYMSVVLEADRQNQQMTQRTFLLALGSGNFEKAKELASKVSAGKDDNELALIFLACDAISHDKFADAIKLLNRLPDEGFGQYTKPLLTAWSLVGDGKKKEALKLLAANAAPNDPTYHMHVGLIEELTGNMNGAAEHYKIAMVNGLDLHTAMMVGNFFERYGQPEITQSIYSSLDKAYPFNPFVNKLTSNDGAPRDVKPNITRAADGASLALFDLATLLYGKRAYDSAQVYGGMVQMLEPKSPFAHLMLGDIAALHHRTEKAIAHYDAIATDAPIYWIAQMRVAEIHEISGDVNRAIQMLTDMSKQKETRIPALVFLGDTHRRHGRFEDAIAAYDAALVNPGKPSAAEWPILYARGIAKERMHMWDAAEKDLLQALEFQPDNPMILNFIAYSWADHGIKLDQALEYAKQAAALRPHDGYILDSYGWTLFRLGKYHEAIAWLEQAVEEVPNDSTLLDHLGDAYWQVGRHNEARNQWRHAADLSRDPAFKQTVQQKVQNGITVPKQAEHQQAKL